MSFACYVVLSMYGAYLSSAAPAVQTTHPVVHALPPTMSTNDVNIQVHDQLVTETMQLNQVEKTTLDSYRLNRFHDPDATAENINIIGLPIASELSLNTRLMASESDLLATHIDNINVYEEFIMMIKSDEAILYKEDPNNYVDELQQISVLTTRVLNKAQSIVDEEKLSGKSLANNAEANYKTVTDKSTLNVITLKVLEEYYWYLVIAERDFDTMMYNHQVVPV